MKPRLLVIEMHHLGDAVMALPVLRAASRKFEVRVLCRPAVAAMLGAAGPDCLPIPCAGWREVFRQVPRLGAGDAAACAWPDTRAHLAMRRSGAGTRVGVRLAPGNFYGVAQAWRRRRLFAGQLAARALSLAGPLLTAGLDREPGAGTHWQMWEQVGRSLALTPDFSVPWMRVAAAPQKFQAFVADARAAGNRLVAVHAGGRLPTKRWATGNFEALLKGWFPANRVSAAILHAPGEPHPAPQAPGQEVFECAEPAALPGFLALADGALTHDSFAAHAAAAVGVPGVTIFGSGDPAWFAPFGSAGLAASSEACTARPCVDRCVHASPLCLDELSIRLVESKLSAMLLRLSPISTPTNP